MNSNYSGVTAALNDRFKVQLTRKGKLFYFGIFDDEKEAARAADRAMLITQPWSSRGIQLNFRDSVAPEASKFNEHEKSAVDYLTLHFRECLAEHQRRDRYSEFIPDVVIEMIGESTKALEKAASSVRATLEEARRVMKANAHKMAEQDARIAWLRKRVEDLEKEAADDAAVAHLKGEDGKFVMRKVIPAETPEDSSASPIISPDNSSVPATQAPKDQLAADLAGS